MVALPAVVVITQDESPTPDSAAVLEQDDFAGVLPGELCRKPRNHFTVQVGDASPGEPDTHGRAGFEAFLGEELP